MTATTIASPILTELATIYRFLEATAGDLPDPCSISVYGSSAEHPSVHMLFESLEDVQSWAAYLQVPVEARDCREKHHSIHHNVTAQWGPTHGKMVQFDLCYIEDVPEPRPVETYSCSRCGATFGIAGGTGGPEDVEADDYFRSEVERHESGECQVTA